MIEGIEDQDQDQDQERWMLRLKSWKDREGYICEYFSHLLAANPVHNIHSRRRSDPRQWRDSSRNQWKGLVRYTESSQQITRYIQHGEWISQVILYAFGKWPETVVIDSPTLILCSAYLCRQGTCISFVQPYFDRYSGSRHNALNIERVHTSTIPHSWIPHH